MCKESQRSYVKGLSSLILDDEEEVGDDEFERETSLLFLQISAINTFEALHLAKQELEILEHMAKLMNENNGQLPAPPPPPEPVTKETKSLLISIEAV